ncbi:MAG TPA: fumarylacetoacetate hydrolase family protein [Gemmatimonadaceae bacterium]|nr:fumarylacetoacetate hydrolase family protein [Gemmatimonadaceae bacterium]
MNERPGKIVCVGRNYREHAAELGNAVPAEPLLFLKPSSAIIRNGEAIVTPSLSRKVEHEGEIGVVIGEPIRRATEAQALASIRGIVALNDVTARDIQKSDPQWTRGKGFDTFCPIGPEWAGVPDFDRLEVITRVNGVVRQRAVGAEMVFSVPALLAYISQVMTLEPGDIVATGTPAGVGPLVDGDTVVVEVVGCSIVSNPVVAES